MAMQWEPRVPGAYKMPQAAWVRRVAGEGRRR